MAKNKKQIVKKPPETEIAASTSFNSASMIGDTYLKVLSNPDKILITKGAGNLEVYTELLRDDQVQSTFQQRRRAVTSSDWNVDPGADDPQSIAAAKAFKEVLDDLNFDDVTDKQLFAMFYGYSVAELLWYYNEEAGRYDFNVKVRDRNRFRFSADGTLHLLRTAFEFEEMPARKFWTISVGADNSDNPYGVGLAQYLYWPCYFKRSDIKFWLIFLEKFGAPTAIGKMPPGKAQIADERAKLLGALQAIATEAAVVIPDGAEVELLEATRGGAGTYEEMLRAMDSAIAKIVLSQTMTTDDGSSRSQAEVHAGVKSEVVTGDADLICESFNRGPVKWWTEYNFAGAKPPRVWRTTEAPEDLTDRAERDNKIFTLGFKPTLDYIKKTYGEGWEEKPEAELNQNPLLMNQKGKNAQQKADKTQQFAESAAILALKAGQRIDQQALFNDAVKYASQYEGIIGDRVQQLIDLADHSGDYETFNKLLYEAFAEGSPPQQVQKIERATFITRLMGLFRAQREPQNVEQLP